MTGKIDAFRDFLSRNEILFKTITATILSVMAVTVSVAQFVTARHQVGLSELQARIAEANALPIFELAIHQKLNDATGKYDDNYMEIVNSGGPVHDFNAEPMYFLRISANANMQHEHPRQIGNIPLGRYGSTTFDVPVGDYFGTQAVSAVSKGTLTRLSGNHNNATFNAIDRSAREIATGPRWAGFVLDQLVYVRLTYRDLLDRPHEDFYEVPSVGSGSRLSDEDGRLVRERWRAGQRANLTDIKAEQLVTEAANRIEKEQDTAPKQ